MFHSKNESFLTQNSSSASTPFQVAGIPAVMLAGSCFAVLPFYVEMRTTVVRMSRVRWCSCDLQDREFNEVLKLMSVFVL